MFYTFEIKKEIRNDFILQLAKLALLSPLFQFSCKFRYLANHTQDKKQPMASQKFLVIDTLFNQLFALIKVVS